MTTRSTRSLLAAAAVFGTVLAPLHLAEARNAGAAFGITTGTNKQDPVVRVTRDHRGEPRPVQPGYWRLGCNKAHSHKPPCIYRDHRR
jgi:2-keto-3-deoxy-6-phosphogluconate aldolase